MHVIEFLWKNIVIIALCIAFSFQAYAQASSVSRPERISIRAEKQPFGTVVGLLMESYGMRIGFEESTLDRKHDEYDIDPFHPQSASQRYEGVAITAHNKTFEAKEHPITLDIKNGTLDDVMKAIVSQMSWYEWELRDEVVNIYPKKGRDPRLAKLLDTTLERFEMRKGSQALSIMFALAELPELKEFLKQNNMGYDPEIGGAQIVLNVRRKQQLEAEVVYSNLTFRDLLNRLSIAKGGGGWKLRVDHYRGTEKDYIDLEI